MGEQRTFPHCDLRSIWLSAWPLNPPSRAPQLRKYPDRPEQEAINNQMIHNHRTRVRRREYAFRKIGWL